MKTSGSRSSRRSRPARRSPRRATRAAEAARVVGAASAAPTAFRFGSTTRRDALRALAQRLAQLLPFAARAFLHRLGNLLRRLLSDCLAALDCLVARVARLLLQIVREVPETL